MMRILPFLSALLLLQACQPSRTQDPLAEVDKRYSQILTQKYAAQRDTSRNIHNTAARAQVVEAEKREATFFSDPSVKKAIEEGLLAPESSPARIRAEAWKRHATFQRSWKPEERERESELLASLDEKAAAEASWVRRDGQGEVKLAGNWDTVSRAADTLDEDARHALAAEYVDHRMNLVGDDLRELIRLRNKVAKREGFDSYWELALYHRGCNPGDISALIQELDPVIRPVNHANRAITDKTARELGLKSDMANQPLLLRKSGLSAGPERAEPWFDTDLAEDRVLRGLMEMGIDLGSTQIYTGPSRTTRRGAYGFPIRPPDNIAVSISVDRRYGLWEYEAYAHEAGHVWWWRSLGPEALPSPVVWEPPIAYVEGFAQLFERLLYEPAWTARYVPDLPTELRAELARWRAAKVATWVTEAIIMAAVEERAYQAPDSWGAVTRFCSDMEASYELYSGATPVTRGGIPYCEALLSPLTWHNPGFAQSYILSYVTEARLYDALVKDLGQPIGNPKVGPWLANIAREGGATSFPARVQKVAGEEPRTDSLRRYIHAAATGLER